MIAARPQRAVRPMPVRPCTCCQTPTRQTLGILSDEPGGPAWAIRPLCLGCIDRWGRDAFYVGHYLWTIESGSLLERCWLCPGARSLADLALHVAAGRYFRLINPGDSDAFSHRLALELLQRI